jgi:hypothetical protein
MRRPYRPCRLCLKHQPLCDSHLLPKAVYRLLRSRINLKNPHPLVLGEGFVTVTSEQARDYLLCENCEQRFHRRGEDWVMRHFYRKQRFRLREMLLESTPSYQDADIRFYEASKIPGIDTEAITYFGMSVFWRAAAHSWKLRGERIEIDLGCYAEALRTFLLDETAFPIGAALAVQVGIEDKVMEFALPPMSHNEDGFHVHRFTMLGVTFILFVGGRVPREAIEGSFAPMPEHLITIYPQAERLQISQMAQAIRDARRRMTH